jgi:hypothetical protein
MPDAPRTRSRYVETRATSSGNAATPSSTSSSSARPSTNSTVVCVVSADSVSDSEPAAGRFSAASRLPQYLTSAMFAHARAVADGMARRYR